MGIHVQLYPNRNRGLKYHTYLGDLTLSIIKFFQTKNCFAAQNARISLYDLNNGNIIERVLIPWNEFEATFNKILRLIDMKRINRSMQVTGTIKLNDPKLEGKIVNVNFEIYFPSEKGDIHIGDFLFDIGGKSKDFPDSKVDYDFNTYFVPGISTVQNRELLSGLLKLIRDRNHNVRNIDRINVGSEAMPWYRIHSCIYIYRSTSDLFQNDLLFDFRSIQKELNDSSLVLKTSERKRLREIWNENEDRLSLFNRNKLREKLWALNSQNRFIDDYFKKYAEVDDSASFVMFSKGEFYTLLYPVLEQFYIRVTKVLKDVIPSFESIWKNFSQKWDQLV